MAILEMIEGRITETDTVLTVHRVVQSSFSRPKRKYSGRKCSRNGALPSNKKPFRQGGGGLKLPEMGNDDCKNDIAERWIRAKGSQNFHQS
ncbi:hypothetical protein CEXT_96811 [Caerostris extrusa]|uniref:Uncharacterized protein n=1 Tax=Caerostris extrusa TaxID=172846 RepID=A0AAV4NPV6_CAEEX|nr:hypothetical protein CEXT_96811 [Caerostris extrusa]